MKVNARQLHEKIARMQARRKAARHAALAFIGGRISQQVAMHAPADTHRFVRGYLLGFQRLGHFHGQMPGLQRSKYIGAAIKVLVEQYELWRDTAEKRRRRLIERYPNGAPRGQRAAYNTMRRELKKAQDRATRSREELEKFRSAPYGIIMSPLRWAWSPKDRHLVTVRPRPYGGSGSLLDTDTRSTARILTREPHAEFVERARATLGPAVSAAMKGTTFEKSARRYVSGIKNVAQVQGAARERFLAGK